MDRDGTGTDIWTDRLFSENVTLDEYNLFTLISDNVFVKWLQQQQKTQDVETTSSSYATRRLKIIVALLCILAQTLRGYF